MSHTRAIAWMVVCTLMWSIAGVATRQLHDTPGLEVTFWRSLFAALTVAIWLLRDRGAAFLETLRKGPGSLVASGLMWALMFTSFMVAMTQAPVANVLVVQCLGPVLTALLAWAVFRRRLQASTWWAIGLAFTGVVVMYAGDVRSMSAAQATGVLIALGVPVGAAINWVVLQRRGQQVDLTASVLIGAVLSAALTGALGGGSWKADGHDIAWLALLGVFQLGIPCILAVKVSCVLRATEASLLSLLEPLFGFTLAWLLAGEQPGPATLLGGLMVIGAISYQARQTTADRG